jgi:hypothetical protein
VVKFFKRKSALERRVDALEKAVAVAVKLMRDHELLQEDWRTKFCESQAKHMDFVRHHSGVMEKWAEALLKAVSK